MSAKSGQVKMANELKEFEKLIMYVILESDEATASN